MHQKLLIWHVSVLTAGGGGFPGIKEIILRVPPRKKKVCEKLDLMLGAKLPTPILPVSRRFLLQYAMVGFIFCEKKICT